MKKISCFIIVLVLNLLSLNAQLNKPVLLSKEKKINKIIAAGIVATVQSPDHLLSAEVSLLEDGSPVYRIKKGDQVLISDSRLGINTSSVLFSTRLVFASSNVTAINESYPMPSGKKSLCTNNCNELTAVFKRLGSELDVVFRVYNDGFAYRYILPGSGTSSITGEFSEVRINNFETSWSQKYTNDYSTYYEPRDWTATLSQSLFCAPVLAKAGADWFLITEAQNEGTYATSQMKANTAPGSYSFQPVGNITATFPLSTPWRAVMLGTIPEIVQSVMISNLNPSSVISDFSWIKPGRAAWDWGGEDANNTVGFAISKKYIDLAADMGWEYYLLDDGWDGSSADYTLKDIVDYASSKSVGVLLWSNHNRFQNSESQIREILQPWKDLGIKGVKVDFWQDDAQEMMQKYDKLLKVAADLNLLVNLHGCTKPSGLNRKWPNLLTSEAVLGGEMYLFNSTMTPANHNINLTLTRNVIGSMDYTPGDFGTKTGQVKQNTTWSHQMALTIAFESGIQHFNDCPQNFKYQMGEQFFREIPVTWDDTKCIEGVPDQYSTLVRRKGDNWYVASLTMNARTLKLPLSFLTDNKTYYAYIYKDGDCKTEIKFEYSANRTSLDTLSIDLAATGGATVLLSTSPNHPKPELTKYEAESTDNLFHLVSRPTDTDGLCSGNKFVGNIGTGNSLTFQKVQAPVAGDYAMTIFYMSLDARSAYVKVNGANSMSYDFNSTDGWGGNGLGFKTVIVTLKEGDNSIEMGNAASFGPNIDRIVIQKVNSIVSDIKNPEFKQKIVTSNGKIMIESDHPVTYTIFNVMGNAVASGSIHQGTGTIDVPQAGVYIVRLSSLNQQRSTKIIVMK